MKGVAGISRVPSTFVADADSLSLSVYVLPAQRQYLARPGTGHQHYLQAGGDARVLELLHGGKPCGQLPPLQNIRFNPGLAQCFAGFLVLAGFLTGSSSA